MPFIPITENNEKILNLLYARVIKVKKEKKLSSTTTVEHMNRVSTEKIR